MRSKAHRLRWLIDHRQQAAGRGWGGGTLGTTDRRCRSADRPGELASDLSRGVMRMKRRDEVWPIPDSEAKRVPAESVKARSVFLPA